MRVLVTCERRFKRTRDGSVWTTATDDREFWQRYLGVFEEVLVLARVEEVGPAPAPSWRPVEGPGVRVLALPNYVGPSGLLRKFLPLRRLAGAAVRAVHAVILRVPSHVAMLVTPALLAEDTPFAIEVVGDPYEAFSRGAGVGSPIIRPLLRVHQCRLLRRLCAKASAVSYVTERALQSRFPAGPDAFVTHYSSIELRGSQFAARPRSPAAPGEPVNVVSVGSMELAYKGFEDLLFSMAQCVAEGLDLRLVLIGGGRGQGKVASRVASLGLEGRVTLTGELPGPESVLARLRDAHLFILASRTEGLPRVVIEAMSQGLPCLGSRVGGTPELLDEDCLFEAGDWVALSERIAAFVREPARMAVAAERNLARAQDFVHEKLQPRREALYRHLQSCARRRPSRALRHHVLSPGVLGFETNVADLSWPYGNQPPAASWDEYRACAVRLEFRAEPTVAFRSALLQRAGRTHGKYHWVTGLPGQDEVLYERPLLLGSRLLLECEGLLQNRPLVKVNKNYLRFVFFRVMNLHSAGFVLADLTALLLLRQGLATLHCSSFRHQGRTGVVFAASNTGKTLTTMKLCLEHGADFIAEDLAVTDGSLLYGVPWTSTFRHYAAVDSRRANRALLALKKALPFIEYVPGFARNNSILEYLPAERIIPSAPVTDVIVLEQGDGGVTSLGLDETVERLVNLNRSEFNYARCLVSNAYEYFNPPLDVSGMVLREREMLRQLAEKAERRILIRSEDPTVFPLLVLKEIHG